MIITNTIRFDLLARLPENVKYTRKFPFCSINKKISNIEYKLKSVKKGHIFENYEQLGEVRRKIYYDFENFRRCVCEVKDVSIKKWILLILHYKIVASS